MQRTLSYCLILLQLIFVASWMEDKEICSSRACTETSVRLFHYLDETIDPCEDFYEFACGNYIKEAHVPEGRSKIDALEHAKILIEERLRNVLEQNVLNNASVRAYDLTKLFYRSCANETAIRINEINDVHEILKECGEWPVLSDKWDSEQFFWGTTVRNLRTRGLNADSFFSFYTERDSTESSSTYVPYIDQANLDLNREFFLDDNKPVLRAYSEYLIELAVLFGAKRKVAENDVRDVISFRKQLAKITVPPYKMTIQSHYYTHKFYESTTFKLFREQLEKIKDKTNLTVANWKIDIFSEIINFLENDNSTIVYRKNYLEQVFAIWPNKRVQANHIYFQAIRSLIPYLSEKFRELERQLQYVTNGEAWIPPRWAECVDLSSKLLNVALKSMYVQRYFKEDAKDKAMEIIFNIKYKLIQKIYKLGWISANIKRTLVKKFENLHIILGYEDELINDDKLNSYYETLEINSTQHFLYNLKKVTEFKFARITHDLIYVHKVYEKDWTTRSSPKQVEIVYDPQRNELEIPSAILQGLYFENSGIQSMNYGSLGTFIEYTIFREISNSMRHLKEPPLQKHIWSNSSSNHLYEIKQCFNNKFLSFSSMPGNVLDEILTRNLGLKMSYLTYKMISCGEEDITEELTLRDFNYTSRQLFWISYGNSLCSKKRSQHINLTNDDLFWNRLKAIVPLRNLKSFAEDFQCSDYSYMNPNYKCEI